MSIRFKLLSLLPKLIGVGYANFKDLLNEFPEAKRRSSLVKLYDSRGNRMAFWIGFENDRPVIKEVDPDNPPYSTTELSMHVDTFVNVLKGELDFRTAYLYDLIDVKTNDGLPTAYHVLLWAAYFDKLVEIIKK